MIILWNLLLKTQSAAAHSFYLQLVNLVIADESCYSQIQVMRQLLYLLDHSHKGVSGAAIANFRFGNFLSESPRAVGS